jgi:hypothetical protein
LIRRLKVSFFRRLKVSIIFANFVQEVEKLIRRLKVLKALFSTSDLLKTALIRRSNYY